MLNLANSGTLYPRQLDLLDRWLCAGTDDAAGQPLDTQIHNFVIDLSSDRGPRRVRKPDTDKPLYFWHGRSAAKAAEIRIALHEGSAPAHWA